MGSEFTFYDYVEDGQNLIHDWIITEAKPVRLKITQFVNHLEGTGKGHWARPMADTLTGYCDGLFEMRPKKGNIQYRILGYHGPNTNKGQVTLLLGFIKSGGQVPKWACDEARRRIGKIGTDPNSKVVSHDHSAGKVATNLGESRRPGV